MSVRWPSTLKRTCNKICAVTFGGVGIRDLAHQPNLIVLCTVGSIAIGRFVNQQQRSHFNNPLDIRTFFVPQLPRRR